MTYPYYPRVVVDGKLRSVHILVAEHAFGGALPKGSVVHHIDGDIDNNEKNNLVICPSQAYHKLIHRREDALEACGNPNWRKCPYCKLYDAPENMKVGARFAWHLACSRKYDSKRVRKSRYKRKGYTQYRTGT